MNNRQSLSLFAGLALLSCGISAIAFIPSGGRVVVASGTAAVLRGQERIAAEKGTVITQGDGLSTAADGVLQGWMEDDSVIALASRSEVQIRQFEPQAQKVVYALKSGGMRIISGVVHPAVLTPQATVTALGTDFVSFICSAACATASGTPTEQGLYVPVSVGQVRVQNPAGTIEAGAGQTVFVPPQGAPRLITERPAFLLAAMAEMQIDAGAVNVDVDVDVIVQPLPPVELPGSPS